MSDCLEELYEKYNLLSDAKEKVSQHSKEYLECIEGTKGNEKEKKLAAQIISKFFKHFPSLQEQALNAILDLCEDDDSMIRISAMKALPLLCKDAKEQVYKVSDILAQLLQLEDQDYTTACTSLTQVYKEDPVNATKAIFSHIHNPSTDENAREKCILFLFKKLIKLQDKLAVELEDLLIEEGKKTLQNSSATEFVVVIQFLISSKLAKTISGQKEIVDLVADRAEVDRDFDPFEEDSNNVDRIIMCVEYILPIFNANVESTKFLKYYTDQILPQWSHIEKMERGEALQLQLLRQLAELSYHCGKLENPSLHVVQIFDKIKDYMPPPPENTEVVEMPNLNFSVVECLLYAFHRLARQCQDFLTADPQVLKDFRTRLTYFSRGVQGCKKSLDTTILLKKKIDKEDSNKVKIAPAVLNNINTLIKDLFYSPPVYKCNIALSFKTEGVKKVIQVSPEKPIVPQKRHVPITFGFSNGSSNKQVRTSKPGDNVKLYTPPSGKFSNNFSSYERGGSGGGRGRGGKSVGRGSRGRNTGRWRN